MSKLGLFLVSLVAAIPALVLTILLVLTFLGNAQNLPGMLWAVSVPTLLTSVLLTAMPVGILLFGPKAEKADTDEVVDDLAVEEESGVAVDTFDDEASGDLMADEGDELSMDSADDFNDASETVSADGEDLFMEDDDFGLEMDEDEKK